MTEEDQRKARSKLAPIEAVAFAAVLAAAWAFLWAVGAGVQQAWNFAAGYVHAPHLCIWGAMGFVALVALIATGPHKVPLLDH